MNYNLIVAMYKNSRGIGYNGKIPWHSKADMLHFYKLTKGNSNNAVIMGSTTWKSLPKKMLPLRDNLILSSTTKKDEFLTDFKNLKDGKEKDSIIKKYLKEVMNFDIEEEMKKSKEDENYFIKKSSQRLMESIMTLEPFESKKYNKTFYWDKKRYYKINEMEYYINEKSNCSIELYIVLLKEEFKERLIDSDYNKIINTPNFIKGWFNSNKNEINFKE